MSAEGAPVGTVDDVGRVHNDVGRDEVLRRLEAALQLGLDPYHSVQRVFSFSEQPDVPHSVPVPQRPAWGWLNPREWGEWRGHRPGNGC